MHRRWSRIAVATLSLALGVASGAAALGDRDGDGVADTTDNCLLVQNADQADADDNGNGDLCECGDTNRSGVADADDVKEILRCVLGRARCPENCDVTGDGACKLDDALDILKASASLLPVDRLRCARRPAEPACTPMLPGVSRDDPAFEQPRVPRARRALATTFTRRDPAATFTFHNCDVSAFATRPGPRIPGYARPVLASLRIKLDPQPPELLSSPTREAKPAIDYDAPENLSLRLPFPDEDPRDEVADDSDPEDRDGDDDGGGPRPIRDVRVVTNPDPDAQPSEFQPVPKRILQRDQAAALPILARFLSQHAKLFDVPRDPATGGADLRSLRLTDYTQGRYFRRARFEQVIDGLPVLGGELLALYDANWNVIGISRRVLTRGKLAYDPADTISTDVARRTALAEAAAFSGRPLGDFVVATERKGILPGRRSVAHEFNVVAADGLLDLTVLIAAADGSVLNLSDNTMRYDDTLVRRWGYPSGNQADPVQYISGVYTRKSNTLTHDFFFMQTDNRGSDTGVSNACPNAPTSSYRPNAYGTTNNSTFIRHTHRNDRDFSIWTPASASFQESNAYYWARNYFNWNKNSFIDLGVMPEDFDDWPRLNFLANTCLNDAGIANSTSITAHLNEGETLAKNWMREECRIDNPNCSDDPADYEGISSSFVTCEGGGCSGSPGLVQHEANHFVMGSWFGIGSSIDCSEFREGKLMHEGMLGSVLPHAYWHKHYGVGYNPPSSDLFTSSAVRGRIHQDSASRLTRGTYTCSYGAGSGQAPYEAGRVAGQALWEIYHGKIVTGNSIGNTERPSNDRTFLNIAYWATDLAWNSDFQDLYEVANRVMQIAALYAEYPDEQTRINTLTDWCDIWDHHGLGTFIADAYCID